MAPIVTLNHVRYGRQRFDLAELKRRLEARLAGGGAPKLGPLLVHTERLLALMEIADTGRNSKDLQSRINAEFAFLLLDFEHVDAIMSGARAPRRRPARNQRALPPPKKKKTR
jgi:hypothetical protein